MANKLKNMVLTSVDMVRNGANQEADICLYKSADPTEAAQPPTEAEHNIFKRFINWLRENAAEPEEEPATPVEKDYTTFETLNADRENSEKLWRYTSALTESIRSIQDDHDLDKDEKLQMMKQSLGQFTTAMEKLLEALCCVTTEGLAKADPEDDLDYLVEGLEKAAPEEEDEEQPWDEDVDPEDDHLAKSDDIDEIEEV